jgi:excisionase family DNA binding protein
MSANAVRPDRSPHELLSIREAARRLHVSEATVRRRCDDDTLGSIRLGTLRRVFASDVDQLFRDASEQGEP